MVFNFQVCLPVRRSITPSSFVDFLLVYTRLLGERAKLIQSDLDRFVTGVNRLDSLSESVAKMQIDVRTGLPSCDHTFSISYLFCFLQLEQLKPVLLKNTTDTEAVIVELDRESHEVETIRAVLAQVRRCSCHSMSALNCM